MAIKILLTNDDGIHADGIQVLAQTLIENIRRCDLSIIAPDRERSAIGHAITMHRPLRVEEVNFIHNPDLTGWAVNGTPADCVKLAIEAILDEKPDLVISGINKGSNLGTDVLYSGTVSAAIEGFIMGIPSVALSIAGKADHRAFRCASEFICRLIPALNEITTMIPALININFPASVDKIKGVKITRLGKRRYKNTFEKRIDPRGLHYYWLAGELVHGHDKEDSDTKAVRDGYISVTPVQVLVTKHEIIPELEKLFNKIDFRTDRGSISGEL